MDKNQEWGRTSLILDWNIADLDQMLTFGM